METRPAFHLDLIEWLGVEMLPSPIQCNVSLGRKSLVPCTTWL